MNIPHFFIEDSIEGRLGDSLVLSVPKDLARHLRTLRLRTGEHLILVDKPGHGWEIELTTRPEGKACQLEGILRREHVDDPGPELTLIQGISAADRMDQTIRQTTELGINRIIPLESERSTVRLDARLRIGKHGRWQRVARTAAEQSGRLTLPVIERSCSLPEAMALLTSTECEGFVLFWEEPGGMALGEALRRLALTERSAIERSATGQAPRLALAIGPEGGFSPAEATLMKEHGAQAVTLGTTILRTETAAVVACALTLHALGGLGAR
jgi:16S rRNA (uracil1498-N3)-methyltransferase